MKTFFYFKENVSFLVYSVAFGTFSGSPLPGGEMEGDGAGCLRCVTGYNGNFCTFSFLFALERVRERRKKRSHPLLRVAAVGGWRRVLGSDALPCSFLSFL